MNSLAANPIREGNTLARFGIVLILIPLALLGAHYGSEWLRVNECLGAGGGFDYGTMSCSFTQTTQYVPYAVRYRWSLNIALGVSLIGVLVSALGSRRRRSSRLDSYS